MLIVHSLTESQAKIMGYTPCEIAGSMISQGVLNYSYSANLCSINSSRFSKKYKSLKSRHPMLRVPK